MSDRGFREQVDRGEVSFRKNDQLEAVVRVQQWRLPTGELHTERDVTSVLDHIKAPVYRAPNLFDTDPSDGSSSEDDEPSDGLGG